MRTRVCKQCDYEGPLNDFPPQKGGRFGRRPVCRKCFNKNRRERGRKETYEQRRRYRIKKNYDLSIEEYEELYESQSGACAICCKELEVLYIDHDHITGDVRGLLCTNCNLGIGNLQDDPTLLRRAAIYLEVGY